MIGLSVDARRIRGLAFYSLLGLLLFSFGVYFIYSIRDLLLPILAGAFLAYVFRPLLTDYRSSLLPDGLRVILMILAIVVGLAFAFKKVAESLPNETEKIEMLVRVQYKINLKLTELLKVDPATGKGSFFYNQFKSDIDPLWLQMNHFLSLSPEQEQKFLQSQAVLKKSSPDGETKYYQYYIENKKRTLQTAEVTAPPLEATEALPPGPKPSNLQNLMKTLSNWIVMPFVFLFLLFDRGQILRWLLSLTPNRYFELVGTMIEQTDRAIGRYLRGTLTQCSLVGSVMAVGLTVVGINFKAALLIGVVAGLTNAIPFVGPLIGLSYGLLFALISEDIGPLIPWITEDNIMLAVVVVVALAQVMDSAVFQPIVLGSAINLHPLVVVLGVMGGSSLFGFKGMLLAIPSIVITKVILESLVRGLRAYRII